MLSVNFLFICSIKGKKLILPGHLPIILLGSARLLRIILGVN